jgi:multisubunit Na+/H+ antiporter MnhB subunit
MVFEALILLSVLMILGAVVALESRDLLSGIISLGLIGFALTIAFLVLQAPDLAIVQIIIETLTLIILIAAILKTTSKDTAESVSSKKIFLWAAGLVIMAIFVFTAYRAFQVLPGFGDPLVHQAFKPDFGRPDLVMAKSYIDSGFKLTRANNLVAAVILDIRGYDTLGEATVLFTSVAGIIAVLRKVGRKRS